ncbi:MAG: GTP-binding protein [archaeon]|nr:GTP-binding protein [archaeon]
MISNNNLDFSDNNNLSVSRSNSSYLGDTSNSEVTKTYQGKIILVGDSAVGKTSIINRFINNNFSDNYRCTVGVEYKLKSLFLDNSTKIELRIWDTCGSEQYLALTKQFFRDSNGAILVFDLTNRTSFEHLENWMKEIELSAPANCQIYLVGNKADLEDQKTVGKNEILNFLGSHLNVKYMDVSAKNGTNIQLLFEDLANLMSSNLQLIQHKIEDSHKKIYKADMSKRGSMRVHQRNKCC